MAMTSALVTPSTSASALDIYTHLRTYLMHIGSWLETRDSIKKYPQNQGRGKVIRNSYQSLSEEMRRKQYRQEWRPYNQKERANSLPVTRALRQGNVSVCSGRSVSAATTARAHCRTKQVGHVLYLDGYMDDFNSVPWFPCCTLFRLTTKVSYVS